MLEKLMKIQLELKAPKSQFNKFGNYKYRNAEDIMESVKPLLAKYECVLNVSDEIVNIGTRYYVKATAVLFDVETEKFHSVTGFAREEESKKGMDGSQITGASSSYARKYALNGLFAIDDTKDSDTTNTHGKEEETVSNVRELKKEFESCKTLADAQKLWDSLTEEERQVYKNIKESTKLRIRLGDIEKEISKLTLKNFDKNWMNIEQVIDSATGETQKKLVEIYNNKLTEIGSEHRYEKLPFA